MNTKILMTSFSLMAILFSSHVLAAPPKETPEILEKGKVAYTTNCLTCHGETGDGMGPAGQYLNPKPRHFVKDKFKMGDSVPAIFQTISKGIAGTGMVAFGHLPEADRWAMAYYVKSLRKGKK